LHGADINELSSALQQSAAYRARLKQLYYDTQSKRLRLMVNEYDLQLALSRVPPPEIDELISLGDEEVVVETLMVEIERLRTAWRERREVLSQQLNSAEQWLDQTSRTTYLSRLNQFHAEAEQHISFADGSPDINPLFLDPRVRLHTSVIMAQLDVVNAEIASIDDCLADLKEAAKHVRTGGLPGWANLPHVRIQVVDYVDLDAGDVALDLSALAVADNAVSHASILLLAARLFESDANQLPSPGSLEEQVFKMLHGREIACGVAITNRYSVAAANGDASERYSQNLQPLIDLLDEILSAPDAYSAADLNLGYLRFIQWYLKLNLNLGAWKQMATQVQSTSDQLAGTQVQ
jgi:hypothetical protein